MPNLFEKAGSALKAAREAWSFGASSGTGAPSASPLARNMGDDPSYRSGAGLTDRGSRLVSAGGGQGQSINYAAKVGDLWRNNSVFIALSWLRRNFPDARIGVAPMGTQEIDLSHPMALLLARPNPYYSFSTLGAGLCFSYVADGNAYALKRRNGYKKPIELYYRPHWMIRPIREKGSKNFVDYYLYKPDSRTPAVRLQPDQVVHLRNGMDPDNELRGMSDLKSLLLSVYTEQESNRFIAAILTNLGMAGAIFNHKPREVVDDDGDTAFATLTQAKAEAVKTKYDETFTGERVGGAMVLDGDWNVTFPSVNVDASFFEKAKDISQADIAAAIGLPAVVLGFHIGLKSATAKASHEDSRKQAYRECLMPMHRSMAEDFDIQLLPDFADNKLYRTAWDYRNVATLADDANQAAKRWEGLHLGGIAMRSEARKNVGLPVRPGAIDDVFYEPKKMGDSGPGNPLDPPAPNVPDDKTK